MSGMPTMSNAAKSEGSTLLFQEEVVNPALQVCVILPVKNEEENISRTLDALRRQKRSSGKPFPFANYEVLLLANNCTDQSVMIATAYQKNYPDFNLYIENIALPMPVAHIGTVRRMLMDSAYERFKTLGKPNGVIASTDSDSEVDPCWLHHTLAEIEKGNDVVGGRILTRPDKSIFRLYYLRDITYKYLVSRLEDLIDPLSNDRWPRHFQCFGASFAVTCRIYDLSGRLPVVPFLEDMAFHRLLVRVDAKIRLSPLVLVSTSSRIQGRVDFGLSIQLKQWGEMTEAHHAMMVEPVGSLIRKLRARKLLRLAFRESHRFKIAPMLSDAANLLHLNVDWLEQEVIANQYFGTFWERVEHSIQSQGWLQKWPLQDIRIVIPELKREIFQVINVRE